MNGKKTIFEQAIAEAKTVQELAKQNAQELLKENFMKEVERKVKRQLMIEADTEEDEDEEEVDEASDSSKIGSGDNRMPEKKASSASATEDPGKKDRGRFASEQPKIMKEVEEEDDEEDVEDTEEAYNITGKKRYHYSVDKSKLSPAEKQRAGMKQEAEDDGEDEEEEVDEDLLELVSDLETSEAAEEEEEEMDEADSEAEDDGEEDEKPKKDGEEEIDLDELIDEWLREQEGEKEEEPQEEEDSEKMESMRAELATANETIRELREAINEVNVLNAKLLYSNKIFRKFNLNESQKLRVIESFDRTNSVREVKLVASTIMESFISASKKKKINEGFASRTVASPASAERRKVITENKSAIIGEDNTFYKRMQKLANIR